MKFKRYEFILVFVGRLFFFCKRGLLGGFLVLDLSPYLFFVLLILVFILFCSFVFFGAVV